MTAFDGRAKTLPEGRRSDGLAAPLRIWRRTGTVGGTKVAPLIWNFRVGPFYQDEPSKYSTWKIVSSVTHEGHVQVESEVNAANACTSGLRQSR